MPLIKSKSKKAFSSNVKKEIAAGKPVKQAVAIAHSVKRKASGSKSKGFSPKKYEATRKKVFRLPDNL